MMRIRINSTPVSSLGCVCPGDYTMQAIADSIGGALCDGQQDDKKK